MFQSVRHIEFNQITEAFPSFLVISLIPLIQSIADGIMFGFISYPIFQLAAGNSENVPRFLYVISGLFFLNFLLQFLW